MVSDLSKMGEVGDVHRAQVSHLLSARRSGLTPIIYAYAPSRFQRLEAVVEIVMAAPQLGPDGAAIHARGMRLNQQSRLRAVIAANRTGKNGGPRGIEAL